MTDRSRIAALRRRAEQPFIRNQHGLWRPNCGERIDEMWPESCDCCGYPKPDMETFDDE